MFSLSSKGSFKRTESYLRELARLNLGKILESNGKLGVEALDRATPVDSGLASDSWAFKVTNTGTSCTISWYNKDVESGFPVAIMLQYGYATGTGGYVAGQDYINPAMRPVFDEIEKRVMKAVNSIR